MEQRIVIKLRPRWYNNARKCQSKAFSIAAEAYGVRQVENIERDNKVVVIGEDIDPGKLTSLIRKKVCNADLVSVDS